MWALHRTVATTSKPGFGSLRFLGAVLAVIAWTAAVVTDASASVVSALVVAGAACLLIPLGLTATTMFQAPDNPYLLMLTLGRNDIDQVPRVEIRQQLDSVWTSRFGAPGAEAYRSAVALEARTVLEFLAAWSIVVTAFAIWLLPLPGTARALAAAVWVLAGVVCVLRCSRWSPVVRRRADEARRRFETATGWEGLSSIPPTSPSRFEQWLSGRTRG